MYRFIHLLLLLLITNVSLCADETKITLELKWLHQFQFAGFYMAKEKGFYREAGLDVEILDGYMKDYIGDVKSGKVDFAVGNSSLAIERSLGFPLVVLGVVFQNSPIVWLARADSNISKPSDMIGKTVIRSTGTREEDELKVLLHKAGVDPDQIEFMDTSFSLDALINKKVDVFSVYKSNEPFLLKEKGIDYRIIDPADYGVYFYGDILFTSEAMLHTHPEAVKAFRDASFKGWEYAFDHLEESVDLVMKKYNPQNKTREHILFEARELQKLARYPFFKPGHMHREHWEQIIQMYDEMGMMHGSIDLDAFLYDMKILHPDVWLLRAVYILGAFLLLVIILVFLSKKYNKTLRKQVALRTKELDRLNTNLEIIVAEKTKQLEEEKEKISIINERYRLTLESIEEGIWDWNLVTNEIFFSKRWKKMLGFEEYEIENAFYEWENRVHPDDKQKAVDNFQANIAGKTGKYENLHRLKHKNGSWVWILDRGKTIFDSQGKAIRMIGTHTDVTEKKILEDKIFQNEKRLKKAQEIAHVGNWEWNMVSGEVSWSDELFRIFGEVPQSFKPTLYHLLHHLPPAEQKKILLRIRKALKGDNHKTELVCHTKQKNSTDGHVRAFIEITQNDLGESIYASGVLLDITKEHKKAEALVQMKKELERSNVSLLKAKIIAEIATESKSTFLANMSHEIRTPLNAITGFIALLKDDETDTEKLKYLQTIDNASDTLLHTINDILDFSKIESGKLEIVKTDFKPYKEIMSAAELFQAKAAEKNIVFNIIYDKKVPEVLFSDILRIKQIINNLLSNAIKFTSQNGTISLSIAYTDNRLSISVCDNGIGIPIDKQKYIFDSFTQADTTTTKEYGGTGLGLSISAQLIQMLNGKFNIKSNENLGSTFSFSIPMREGYLTTEKKLAHDLEKPLKGKILLVEDIETNQLFIGLVLKKAGLEYEVANDGVEAVEKFKVGTYDLILMDENMPRLNGRGAVQQIRDIEKKKMLNPTPIIALTANALTGDRELFLNAGMDDYLSKPVEPATLIKMLHQFLGSNVI